MTPDPANALTFTTLLASKSQATNNTAGVGLSLREYKGRLAVRVNIGVKTAGDNDGTVTVILQTSADNTAANATNYSTVNVATTNNTAASGTVSVDTRDVASRYLFARVILTGTNSPAYPLAVEAIGVKRVQ